MIAHFALMGDLYQYDSYETQASLWNSYPWQIGLENNLDISAALPEASMSKMIWELGDSDSSVGAASAGLGSFGMFATLIVMDQWGNLGSDVGKDPNQLPYKLVGVLSGGVLFVESKTTIIIANTHSENPYEAPLVGVVGGSVSSVTSKLVVISKNTHSENPYEAPLVGVVGGSVSSVTSTLI